MFFQNLLMFTNEKDGTYIHVFQNKNIFYYHNYNSFVKLDVTAYIQHSQIPSHQLSTNIVKMVFMY